MPTDSFRHALAAYRAAKTLRDVTLFERTCWRIANGGGLEVLRVVESLKGMALQIEADRKTLLDLRRLRMHDVADHAARELATLREEYAEVLRACVAYDPERETGGGWTPIFTPAELGR